MTMRAATLFLGLTLLALPAAAQMDSRDAIALQNQILQLRQEMEQALRGRAPMAPPMASPGFAPPMPGGANDLVSRLLDRVNTLEDEVRRLRGRTDVLENQNTRLREDLEKLQGDIEFRFSQGGAAPAAPSSAPATPPAAARPAAPEPIARAPRTPERAIQEGQTALARRDYPAAEAAAREVIASRAGPQQVAAHMLLGDALAGRRDYANAAIAYNEAYVRSRTGPRAPEALLGLASSFQALNSRREACDTLNDLRSQFPNLRPPLSERAEAARQRSGCR
jgi:TolA-binding protein